MQIRNTRVRLHAVRHTRRLVSPRWRGVHRRRQGERKIRSNAVRLRAYSLLNRLTEWPLVTDRLPTAVPEPLVQFGTKTPRLTSHAPLLNSE